MAAATVEVDIKSTGQILLTYQGYMDLHGFSVPRLQLATEGLAFACFGTKDCFLCTSCSQSGIALSISKYNYKTSLSSY